MWSPSLASFSLSTALGEIQISPDQVQVLIYVILAAVIVGGIGSFKGVLDIIRFFRGDPPSDQRYASKKELADALEEIAAVEARTVKAMEAMRETAVRERSEIREGMKEMFDEIRSIHRAVGRIEGHIK